VSAAAELLRQRQHARALFAAGLTLPNG